MRIAAALGLYQAGQQVYIQVVFVAGIDEHLVQVGGVEFCVPPGCRGSSWRLLRNGRRRGRRRIGNLLVIGDLLRCEFDVVIFICAEIESCAAIDFGVMIAAHLKAIAQGDAFACSR